MRNRSSIPGRSPIVPHGVLPSYNWSYFHPMGTCAIGRVVDAAARVAGVDNLNVVDAAILPEVFRVQPRTLGP